MGNMMLEAKALDLGSIWIHRAKEEFELPEYKQLLKDLGVEGEWEGIGHCVVGYADGDLPKAAPRKENRSVLGRINSVPYIFMTTKQMGNRRCR